MHKNYLQHIIIFLFIVFAGSIATGIQGAEMGDSPTDVPLPPMEKREILGTWVKFSSFGESCTRSFEKVDKRIYQVYRCGDGSGGDKGSVISQVSSGKFLALNSPTGDHFVILAGGDLSLRDKDGEVDVEPKSSSLWPKPQFKVDKSPKIENKKTEKATAEDAKTVGLNCYDVGYRYGYTATNSMKGVQVNPLWDFATPERCRNDHSTHNGMQAGMRAAW